MKNKLKCLKIPCMYSDMLQSQIDEAISNYDMDRILALKKIYTTHKQAKRIRAGIRRLKAREKDSFISTRLLVKELDELTKEYYKQSNIIDFPGK